MKKFLISMIALFVSFAFATVVMAETAATEPMKAKGTVTAYDAGQKTISVKVSKKTHLKFGIAEDATVTGEVKVGAKVLVTYKKEEGKKLATSIAVEPMKTKGTVTAYDAGQKTISVKVSKKAHLNFGIAEDATVTGELKVGAAVSVTYKKEEGKMIATSIAVQEKKAKAKSK